MLAEEFPAYDPKAHDPATCTRHPCRRCSDHKAQPPAMMDHDARGAVPTPDPVVRSIGLPGHPSPAAIADALEATADALRSGGLGAITMAHALASRGFAASTLGDGGSRATDATSMPERSAYRPGDRTDDGKPIPPPPSARWWAADHHYARLLADLWRLATRTKASTDELLHHASDDDPLPAGTGGCRACSRVCRPDAERPGNRIVSGLCPTCYKAWRRYDGPMQWSAWVAKRREDHTERDSRGNVVAIHTPEPDHELDLSRELPADMA